MGYCSILPTSGEQRECQLYLRQHKHNRQREQQTLGGLETGNIDKHNSLLVGAPRAHSGQPNVIRGGAVYSCSSRITRCAVQYFDRKDFSSGKSSGNPAPDDVIFFPHTAEE
uniref:Uncharacterized protein n=1 Tax=Romanomermis culicivorax TaxID=13658 RepID=A0A915JIP7_ROMCU